MKKLLYSSVDHLKKICTVFYFWLYSFFKKNAHCLKIEMTNYTNYTILGANIT